MVVGQWPAFVGVNCSFSNSGDTVQAQVADSNLKYTPGVESVDCDERWC